MTEPFDFKMFCVCLFFVISTVEIQGFPYFNEASMMGMSAGGGGQMAMAGGSVKMSFEFQIIQKILTFASSHQIQAAQFEIQNLFASGQLYEFILVVNYLNYIRTHCAANMNAINQILAFGTIQEFMANPWNIAYSQVIDGLHERLLAGDKYPPGIFDSLWCETGYCEQEMQVYEEVPYQQMSAGDFYAPYMHAMAPYYMGSGYENYAMGSAEMESGILESVESSMEAAAVQATHEECMSERKLAPMTTTMMTTTMPSNEFTALIQTMHKPESESEMVFYSTMVSFLQSEIVIQLMSSFSVTSMESTQLFHQVLSHTVMSTTISHEIRVAAAYYFKHTMFDFSALVTFIHQPSQSFETIHYETMVTFLSGYEIYLILINESIMTKMTVDIEFMRFVYQQIMVTTSLSQELHIAAKFYLSRKPFFDFARFVKLIPESRSENEMKLYTVVTNLLMGEEIYGYMQDFFVMNYSEDKDLLRELFISIETNQAVPDNIRVAVKYYLNIFTDVKLSISKVVKKHLDLKSIFTDAFDFSTFNKEQYDAYDHFIKYISDLSADKVEGFSNWNDSTTRTQFTVLFLDYMATQSYTPPEIASYITVLKPLVSTATSLPI